MPTGSCFWETLRSSTPGSLLWQRSATVPTVERFQAETEQTTLSCRAPISKSPKGHSRKSPKRLTVESRSLIAFALDCGTRLFRYGDTFGIIDGVRIIKAGVLNDVNILNNVKPGAELFAHERTNWVPALQGAI
ncbi:uncharacterized protein A1O5_03814 [Cladophialophora psammophila CBS 110553]|uniref:Uncharacterized protein n=1 Tax=Cladophialophora psammophila CBS 110553 TaxID=1182543 RepID=W9WXH3_9EURO|nr:uncharacterized protein A1O5_03814 [Cladophialophora psammophila CBS 110553]EXJ72668.1 hypothetical protein A1O5_03814 [Cladophialophora psammophila CBS 110553]